MTEQDLNIVYNARKTVLNHEEISSGWDERAEEYREETKGRAEFDVPYGSTEREQYDFFPAGDGAPVCAWIHGGYWRSRDRKTFSHIARGMNERGIAVAIPSYNLVPKVSVTDIIDEMRRFLMHLHAKTGKRAMVAGHSAGGHLAGSMLATDWSKIEGAPDDLVTHAFSVSGLFDLRPLLDTDINDDLRLDAESAVAASPALWDVQGSGKKFVAAVGSEESDVFRWQSSNVAEVWSRAGMDAEYLEMPGLNHFTVVDAVTDPGGDYFGRLVAMIELQAGG